MNSFNPEHENQLCFPLTGGNSQLSTIELSAGGASSKNAERKAKDAKRALEQYYRNRDAILAHRKSLRDQNREALRIEGRARYKARREALGFSVKKVRLPDEMTPEIRKATSDAAQERYRDRHRLKLREKHRLRKANEKREAKENDPEEYKRMIQARAAYDKMYRRREIEKRRKWSRGYVERWKSDTNYIIRRRLRARIKVAVKHGYGNKAFKTMDLLGCTIPEYRKYLESLFTPGMSWEKFNAGEIEIDHKIPCSAFDLADPEQQKKCFHFSNTQPMFSGPNRKKGCKLPHEL